MHSKGKKAGGAGTPKAEGVSSWVPWRAAGGRTREADNLCIWWLDQGDGVGLRPGCQFGSHGSMNAAAPGQSLGAIWPPSPSQFLRFCSSGAVLLPWWTESWQPASSYPTYLLGSGAQKCPGPPTLGKIQPTPGHEEAADKRAFEPLRACKQGLLSGLPSGISMSVGLPVGRARLMSKGIIFLGATSAGLGVRPQGY